MNLNDTSNKKLNTMSFFLHKNELLLHSLQKFFDDEKIAKILPILNGKSSISLRLLDWFVTNFARIYSTTIVDSFGKVKFIYLDYKAQLKAFSKKMFDPFCRRDRIQFPYGNNENIQTTVGQLNFFRWILQNNILEYLSKNWKMIEDDMNQFYKNKKKGDISLRPNNFIQLNANTTKGSKIDINRHENISIVLTFE